MALEHLLDRTSGIESKPLVLLCHTVAKIDKLGYLCALKRFQSYHKFVKVSFLTCIILFLLPIVSVIAQEKKTYALKGKVVDESGEPLPASISGP